MWRWPLAAVLALNVAAMADDYGLDTPEELEGVGVTERLGETIPLDLEFRDSAGVRVTFRELLADGKPAIITPVFFNCPMLCTQVLNGLTDGLIQLDEWSVGDEFNIITYSFNPDEGPDIAAPKREAYLELYDRDGAKPGWQFLTGPQKSITAMNDAIGMQVRRTEDGLYAHSATIVFVTPSGRIARYMNDVMFRPSDLRFALVEAGEGKIGSPMDKFLLFTCFMYDPDKGSFTPSAWKLMRAGGLATIILLGGFLSFMWIKESVKRHAVRSAHEDVAASGSGAKHAD